MYWSSQLLGRSFQKQEIASSHQNAWFGIYPHSGRGRPPSPPNTQPGLWPGAWGVSAPVLGPKPWSPQLFSRGYAPGLFYPTLTPKCRLLLCRNKHWYVTLTQCAELSQFALEHLHSEIWLSQFKISARYAAPSSARDIEPARSNCIVTASL